MDEDMLDIYTGGFSVSDEVPEDLSFQVYQNGKITDESFRTYRGKWCVLFFYPGDFTFVCPTELGELASMYDTFQKEGVEILSMSTDTAFSHKVWHEISDTIRQVQFPMGSDHRQILVNEFDVFCEADGLAYRGTFIIDPEGVIRSVEINDNSIGRSSKELLRKVRAAKYVASHNGQVCPASWEEGKDTLTPGEDLVGKI